ncbi:uncharacterized protein LOC110384189 isoform X1 [Helicoverpa armigera]|uniref:uncharacterized protein LOC110384189 isoform X1 n=2 Tax=Helicoverpa TaxID=7112 RepID=UPI002111BE0D|nr:uncharacterized protein LOC110384189 isoform X1 [Helicoverpa armigera]XP_049697996.1 uncharacterized protein LOC126053481 isoform X1 [Helicoverpa armigera]
MKSIINYVSNLYKSVYRKIKMKIIIAFLGLISGISAVPFLEKIVPSYYLQDERLVSGSIESAIQDASQSIKDAGLDPFHIKRESSSFALPVPVIFNYEAFIEEILSTGLSDIKIHRVNYNIITSRLNFDIELPLIHFSAGAAAAEGVLFSNNLDFSASGKVEIVSIRVTGQVRVSIGIISGISIRSITINLTLRDIVSDVNLVILGRDLSDEFNNFVGSTIPNTIKAHNKEINELLEIVLLEVINANL